MYSANSDATGIDVGTVNWHFYDRLWPGINLLPSTSEEGVGCEVGAASYSASQPTT